MRTSLPSPHLPSTSVQNTFQYHTACPVIDQVSGIFLEYRHLMKGHDQQIWETVFANGLERLAQCIGTRMQTGNETFSFIHPSEIPLHKKVTYGRLVVDICPLKNEKFRVRPTVRGGKLEFFGNSSSVTASLATVKILLNSVVSTPNTIFSSADIKDFFYGTLLPEPEYMKLSIKSFVKKSLTTTT